MTTQVNINIPIESLLALLRAEGIKNIGTTAILDIQKVLANLDEKEIRDYRKLKYFIRPIVCRNKEDQEKFNQVFDRYVQWIEAEKLNITRIKPQKKQHYLWLAAAGVAAIALVVFLLYIPSKPKKVYTSLTQTTYWPTGKYPETAIGDSIGYEVYLQDTIAGETYITDWTLADSTYSNARIIKTVYKHTGNYTAKVVVKNKKGEIIIEDSISTAVLCEHPPSLQIDADKKNGIATYQPRLSDSSNAKTPQHYKWYINDSLVSAQKTFTYRYSSNRSYTVKLIADTKGLYCSKDSLTAIYDETPDYSLTALSLGAVPKTSSFLTNNLLAILLSMVIAPAFFAWFIYRRWKKTVAQRQQDVAEKKAEPGKKNDRTLGPFFIEFKDQDYKISPEEQVSRLADGLRKRQLSEALQLNMKKTINKTIRAGGFPSFEFVPRTKPLDFLVLIDKEYPDSHLVKLFEYLVERLRTEQVNIILYDYYKEPLYLNNKRFNHVRIPLERLAQLYPDTLLFLFTSGNYLLEPLDAKLKPWATEKLKLWEHQVIITPLPKKDWTYKETVLQQAGFVVIPADLYQNNLLKILLDVISLQVEATKQEKIEIPQTYSARYVNFQDFDRLEKYLNNAALLQWVSATAVYPHVNWKVTIAIGKALEELNADKQYKLITYENLLKISRISWMQDGIIDDTLRLEMLRYIDNATEATARKAIVELLEEIKETFTINSFAKEEYDLHRYSNLVLLHANDRSNAIPDEALANVKGYIAKGYFDWPQTVYHNEAQNTLLKDASQSRSIPIAEYVGMLDQEKAAKEKEAEEKKRKADEEAKAKERRRKLVRNLSTLGAFVFLCALGTWLMYKNQKLALWRDAYQPMQVILHNTGVLNSFGEITLSLDIDSVYTARKINDSLFTFTGIAYDKKDRLATLRIQQAGSPAITASVSIDSSYNVYVSEPINVIKQPLSIRYNNASYYTAVQQQLNAALNAFNIDDTQLDFKDSSKIVYYAANQKAGADSVAAIVKRNVGKNVAVELANGNGSSASLLLYLNVDPPKTYTCNPISISALPASLNEIFSGGTSNRLINIDLKSNLIYYSTGDKNTFGTYRIDEVCLDASGAYRITTRAGNQYQVFFVKDVQAASFRLSVCANRYNNKQEITTVDGSYCDRFNTMTFYLSNNAPTNISANTLGLINFSTAQRDKLDNIFNNVKEDAVISLEVNINATRTNTPTDARYELLKNNFPTGPSRAINTIGYNIKNNTIQWSKKDFKGTPFDRDFIVIRIENTAPAPDPCSRTYYSMDEALKVSDPLNVCKLNVEKDRLVSLPAQLYNFKNMQELTLGTTSIPEADIDRLQKALPKCVIKYTAAQVQTPSAEEITVGEIRLDAKNYPDNASTKLISDLARILKANAASKIRLEATVNQQREEKSVQSGLEYIKRYFSKEGIDPKGNQLSDKIIVAQANQVQNQQQQQQQNAASKSVSKNTTIITVIGINWPDNSKKAAN